MPGEIIKIDTSKDYEPCNYNDEFFVFVGPDNEPFKFDFKTKKFSKIEVKKPFLVNLCIVPDKIKHTKGLLA